MLDNLLLEIDKINQKYPAIDWGGCGTFSYYLSEKLNSLNISNEIVYTPEAETPQGAYRCDIKFDHIMVKVGDYLLDNSGIRYSSNFRRLNNKKLYDMLQDKKLWNNVFPHEQWDSLAQDILNMELV